MSDFVIPIALARVCDQSNHPPQTKHSPLGSMLQEAVRQGPELSQPGPGYKLGALGQQLVSRQKGAHEEGGLWSCLETLSLLEGDSVALPTCDQTATVRCVSAAVHCPVMWGL